MISFECDYNNGAHPKVVEALVRTNGEQTLTYGADIHSDHARELIRAACETDDAQVFLLTGGTQANLVVIDAMLAGHEAVIAADTGHISIHEAGAIEACGHKVIALGHHEGKLRAEDLSAYMEWFINDESREHLAQPAMVYLSFPTELGTLYDRAELAAIADTCARYGLKLFIDGARLGYGVEASDDVNLPWLCRHCDVLYIGGTKVGALCGEAVVFTHNNAPRHFFTMMKRRGAVLAKGRLTGVQFEALFTPGDNARPLYFEISRHAIAMARQMKAMFRELGLELWLDSPTNQQFVVLDNDLMHRLEQHVLFTHWQPLDGHHMACRFVTSWATTEDDLRQLREILVNDLNS